MRAVASFVLSLALSVVAFVALQRGIADAVSARPARPTAAATFRAAARAGVRALRWATGGGERRASGDGRRAIGGNTSPGRKRPGDPGRP